ncbi:acyl-CoA binding domain-containing protein 6 [Crenichthys baileyi]|uniref:Acyl-CoA-binding domain-containing protein 6 n=1 Tax=Crenichthys baileyi TaxID=28760 RepID=A0AAV9SRG5_9TELE
MASGSPSSSPDTATGSGTDPARPDTGEPLGGAGSDSDSDLGLSKFDCSAMEMGDQLDGEELEPEFESAADRVKDLLQTASRDQLLYLYARYKQVKVGKCNTSKPGFFDFEGQRKWQAWKQLGDMEPQQAMREYISLVNMLDPEGATKQRRGAERRTGFGGAAVSSLYQEEMIRCFHQNSGSVGVLRGNEMRDCVSVCVPLMDCLAVWVITETQAREEDKNIFDYCRENNIEHIRNAISSQKMDVNTKDEEGRALLHWACDRGHKELVSVLLQHKADINTQDNEGQTALHYASACEFADIVELLLNSGADPSIKDMEGSLPEEVTESSTISSLLHQYTAPKG